MIVQPSFSERELVKILEKDISWKDEQHFIFRFKNSCTISLFIDLTDPGILLSFYYNSFRLAVIRYYCSNNPNRTGFSIHHAEYCITADRSSIHGTVSVSQDDFREWLINIPEFSEWSIWNQV